MTQEGGREAERHDSGGRRGGRKAWVRREEGRQEGMTQEGGRETGRHDSGGRKGGRKA